MIIGIMGKSGSGKSTITNLLNEKGNYLLIDVDKVNHELIENTTLKQDIIIRYPETLENGKINRQKLGMILYQDKKKMDEYNKLVWIYLEKKLDEMINNTTKIIVLDWMMLPLTKYYNMCDIKILVESSLEIRLERIKKRDKVDEIHFFERDKNSVDYKIEDFDFVINNDKGIDKNELENIRKRIALCKRKK